MKQSAMHRRRYMNAGKACTSAISPAHGARGCEKLSWRAERSGRGGCLGDFFLDLQSTRRQFIVLGFGQELVQTAAMIDAA